MDHDDHDDHDHDHDHDHDQDQDQDQDQDHTPGNDTDHSGGHSMNGTDHNGGHSMNDTDHSGGHSTNDTDHSGGHKMDNDTDHSGGHSMNNDTDHDGHNNSTHGGNHSDALSNGGGHNGHGMGGSDHMMSPFLFTRRDGFFVLFREAEIESRGAFAAALILSCIFAIIATIFSQIIRIHEVKALKSGKVSFRLVGGLLHGFNQLLHYIAMLLVMTMNVWLIIAVVLGHVVGWAFFAIVFGNRFSKDAAHVKEAGCECD